MQCLACSATFSNELSSCPRCSVAVSPIMRSDENKQPTNQRFVPRMPDADLASEAQATTNSTLINFPGSGRAPIPEWRKELSERVREVQARKAREGEPTATLFDALPEAVPALEPANTLGLVPDQEVNPIVAKALKRIENARRTMVVARSSGGAALAVARAVEEPVMSAPEMARAPTYPMPVAVPVIEPILAPLFTADEESAPALKFSPATKPAEEISPAAPVETQAVVQSNLFVPAETSTAVASPALFIDDLASDDLDSTPVIALRRHEDELLDEVNPTLSIRAASGVMDLLLVVFATSPFAAVIELTGSDWSDWHVWGSLIAIASIIMILYQASAVALGGRTWGMSLFSLRVADADFGLYPTFGQSLTRALVHFISLVPAGLGLLLAFVSKDRMTLHDRASNTIVVRSE